MDEKQVVSALALSMQLGTAVYALRLNRLFGTQRAGWSLFGAFALMLAVHVSEAWRPARGSFAHTLQPDFVYLISSALLLIGLAHVGMLFRARLQIERAILSSRSELESRVCERTSELAESNVALQREINQRKCVEVEIRTSQARYRELVDSLDCIVFESEGETLRFTFVSPQCEEVLGYTAERWLSGLTWRDIVHPEDLETVLSACHARSQFPGRATIEFRALAEDGREVWLRQLSTVVADVGDPIKVRGVLLDVTELRQMELQLQHAQRLELVGRLAGGVAHDFNNLLTVIQGRAALLLSSEQIGDPVRVSLREIQTASQRAAQLTGELLAFGRRQTMQLEVLDLNQLVRKVTQMLCRVLGEDIRVETDFYAKPCRVRVDPTIIEQVLLNLAANARESMPRGGVLRIQTGAVVADQEITVDGGLCSAGQYACVQLTDTGCGIAPELIPRIFEPFVTNREVGKGSGLGLATAYGMVRQHNGWIKAFSTPGHGTQFEVFLPFTDEPLPELTPIPTPTQAAPGGETVLVVEDENSVRSMVCDVLQRSGYGVLQAESGLVALGVWREHCHEIALLLTDIVMPGGMDGWQLAETLTRDQANLKVLYTSGYNPNHETRSCHHFLPKPYEVRELLAAVRRTLDSKSTP